MFDENEGELEAVPIAHTTSSPHTTGDFENLVESPTLSSPTRNAPIPYTPVATGGMSTRTSFGIAAQLTQESVIYSPKPEINQLDISTSPILPTTRAANESAAGTTLDRVASQSKFSDHEQGIESEMSERIQAKKCINKRFSRISGRDWVARRL